MAAAGRRMAAAYMPLVQAAELNAVYLRIGGNP
jgi:hypothetical protein